MSTDQVIEVTIAEEASASEEVLEAIAAAEDTDPIGLAPPLYSAVDPEALDALARSMEDRSAWIEFVYQGYLVTVDGSGGVRLEPRIEEDGRD